MLREQRNYVKVKIEKTIIVQNVYVKISMFNNRTACVFVFGDPMMHKYIRLNIVRSTIM